MNTNSELENLYRKHLKGLLETTICEKINCTSPLLLKIDEEKWNDEDAYNVVIFGQEVRGWGPESYTKFEEILNGDIEIYLQGLLNTYYKYFYRKTSNDVRSKSTFMQAFERIEKILKQRSDLKDKKINIIWNNINKLGKSGQRKGMSNELRQIEKESFLVIQKEIEILRPDLLIFLTGPYRDRDIKANFPDVIITKSTICDDKEKTVFKRKYAFLQHPSFKKAVRLYHPNYYRGCTNLYLEELINQLLDK